MTGKLWQWSCALVGERTGELWWLLRSRGIGYGICGGSCGGSGNRGLAGCGDGDEVGVAGLSLVMVVV